MSHKGASTQCHNQQVLAKRRHQPSERDQQAREKLRQKAKIKSHAYIQLGEEALQTVHKTFASDIPVILHLPALVDSTIDTNTPPTLYMSCISKTACFLVNCTSLFPPVWTERGAETAGSCLIRRSSIIDNRTPPATVNRAQFGV